MQPPDTGNGLNNCSLLVGADVQGATSFHCSPIVHNPQTSQILEFSFQFLIFGYFSRLQTLASDIVSFMAKLEA